MTELTLPLARRFAQALDGISEHWHDRQNKTRDLLTSFDAMEEMISASLLRETVARHFSQHTTAGTAPVVLFMDRKGGKAGGHTSGTIISLLATLATEISYVHIGFNTPPRGIGTLLQSSLMRKGTEHGVVVDVVSSTAPAEGLSWPDVQIRELLESATLIITYAPEGSAGLIPFEPPGVDPLIARSHINVLSFPDPEYSVADLPRYEAIVAKRPEFKHIRVWIQILEEGRWNTLGHCVIGSGGDASTRLWQFIDNAKRHPWRLLLEPMAHDLPTGVPLHCPSRTVLTDHFPTGLRIDRVVTAGNNVVLVGSGERT
jgi:hypothetical protein